MDMSFKYQAPGLPDECFARGQVPMSKEEVRVLTLAKAQLRRDNIIYDIGAGTGSISIEAAMLAPEGKVFALEKNEAAVSLLNTNKSKFGLQNLVVVPGSAPEELHDLPVAHRIIVGGSGGNLGPILEAAHAKLQVLGIIVINAITINTLWHSLLFLEKMGYTTDTISVNIARLLPLGSSKAFQSNNPIFIIRGVKQSER